MQQIIIAAAAGLVVGTIIVGVPAFILARAKTKAFKSVCEAYERIISRADARTTDSDKRLADFMDRVYGEKNLPPGGVDMKVEYEERRAEERERRVERQNGRALPARIGKIDQIQADMEAGVRSGKYARPSLVENDQQAATGSS